MSVEFRQRTPAEYLGMLWRNKWLLVVPTICVALAVAWVVRRLPNVYESKSVLIVRPATISTSFVPRMSESDLLFRINSIHQQVVSRSSLEPLIRRYNLYQNELARGASIEGLIERMQKQDIHIQIDRSNTDLPNAFNIAFRSDDRNSARSVTSELSSKYVNAQLEAGKVTSEQTIAFFDQRLAETKATLDALDSRRLDFMRQNLGQGPEDMGSLTQRLTGLYEQQKSYNTELGRLHDAIASIETQKSTVAQMRREQISRVSQDVTDPKTTPAYAALRERRSQLRAELQEMLQTLRPKNPDVIKKQEQIKEIDGELEEMLADYKTKVAEKQKELTNLTDPQAVTYQTQLQNYHNELARQRAALAQTNAGIMEIERRLNAVPGASIALQQMDREYNTQKALYDDLLQKSEQAKTIGLANSNAQGETIQVVDSASLPEQPVAPKREVLYGIGLALGLGVGMLLVAAREVPRLLTVQNTQDAEHYTGLPVLISLPEMLTPREVRRVRVRRLAFATAGLVLAVASVPTLIVILRVTRIIDMLSGLG